MNRRLGIILLLVCLGQLLEAQFSIGGFCSSELGIMHITTDSAKILTSNIHEKGGVGIGYGGGLHIEYKLKNNLRLRTEIGYKDSRYIDRITGLNFGSQPNGGSGEADIVNKFVIKTIDLNFNIEKGVEINNKWNLVYGVLFGYHRKLDIKSMSEIEFSEGKSTLSGLNNKLEEVNFSLGVNTGVEYNLSATWRISGVVNARYIPNKFETHPYESKARTIVNYGLIVRITKNGWT